MNEIIRLQVALENDAEQIRDMMVAIERDETNRWYDNDERPFIPGYDSIDMQKYHMRDKTYYKVMYNDILAGVLLISYSGREHARVDRFYIDPLFQNKGIGSKVITLMEEMYPRVVIWTLDTIQKSIRNHNFYKKNGYVKIGEDKNERYYRKVIGEQQKNSSNGYHVNENLSNQNFRQCNMQNVDIYDVNMRNSKFTNMNLEKVIYQNVNLSNTRFTNVNMSSSVLGDTNMNQIEICHVSLADAYIHDTNLGFEEKVPLTMERCELNSSKIIDSNLQNVSINNCNIEGMKIDGILVTDLIKIYKSSL